MKPLQMLSNYMFKTTVANVDFSKEKDKLVMLSLGSKFLSSTHRHYCPRLYISASLLITSGTQESILHQSCHCSRTATSLRTRCFGDFEDPRSRWLGWLLVTLDKSALFLCENQRAKMGVMD